MSERRTVLITAAILGIVQCYDAQNQPADPIAPPMVDALEVDGQHIDASTLDPNAIIITQLLDGGGNPITGRYVYTIDHQLFPAPPVAGSLVSMRFAADVNGQIAYVGHEYHLQAAPTDPVVGDGLPSIG